jgi:hypothetical protein
MNTIKDRLKIFTKKEGIVYLVNLGDLDCLGSRHHLSNISKEMVE